ncbi:MAG: cysteine desulfurase family protein [Eubacteriales bacterium]|nr:cysteine desulfurase family protein [Eubacteriales bacterium]
MEIRYFDNAATTRLDGDLLPIIQKYNTEKYFNPSALSGFSTEVARDILTARENIADLIGANFYEITFVSCGSEGDNMAMLGCLKGYNGNIVTSQVEHAAVYNTAMYLKSKGVEVRFVDLLPDGRADPESLVKLVDKDTQFVCLMYVNNETGAINDIKTLCQSVKKINEKCLFICDGVQSFGKIKVNVKNLGVDFFIASGHKINAPKGIGFVYHKKNIHVSPLIRGGGQENGMRSGTENVANIMAFSAAATGAVGKIDENTSKFKEIRNNILNIVYQNCQDFYVATEDEYCSPNILTLFFADIKTEVLLHMMEKYGFVFGTGSACSSKNKTSRVITSLKVNKRYKEGMVRISFDKYSTVSDAREFAKCLAECVNNLRKTLRG